MVAPEKDPPLDEPWKPRDPQVAMLEAAAGLSAAADRLTKSVERLERRLAVQDARDVRIVEVLERIEARLSSGYREAV